MFRSNRPNKPGNFNRPGGRQNFNRPGLPGGPKLPGLRGGPNRPGRPGPKLQALLAEIHRAHELAEQGHYAEAAPLFVDLAGKAEGFGAVKRAAHLHLRAARNLLLAGDSTTGIAHAKRAMELFAQGGQVARAVEIHQRLVAELRERNLTEQADLLEKEMQARFGALPEAAAAGDPAAAARKRLPARCPSCGGAVRSDEVDWIDNHSAECVYCGSVIQSNEK